MPAWDAAGAADKESCDHGRPGPPALADPGRARPDRHRPARLADQPHHPLPARRRPLPRQPADPAWPLPHLDPQSRRPLHHQDPHPRRSRAAPSLLRRPPPPAPAHHRTRSRLYRARRTARNTRNAGRPAHLSREPTSRVNFRIPPLALANIPVTADQQGSVVGPPGQRPLPGLGGAFFAPMGATLGATAYNRSGTEQGLTHRLRRRACHPPAGAVHVLRNRDARMPQHLGDHVQRRALGQHQRGARVAQLVRIGSGRVPPSHIAVRRSARSCPGPSASRPRSRR